VYVSRYRKTSMEPPAREQRFSVPVEVRTLGCVLGACTTDAAEELATRLLSGHRSRWLHLDAVGRRAAELAVSDIVIIAAWLHDVGYAPEMVGTTLAIPITEPPASFLAQV